MGNNSELTFDFAEQIITARITELKELIAKINDKLLVETEDESYSNRTVRMKLIYKKSQYESLLKINMGLLNSYKRFDKQYHW